MPNWVANNIELSGESKDIKKLLETVKSKESDFDFNNIMLMPEALKGTSSPAKIVSQEEYDIQQAKKQVIAKKLKKGTELSKEEKQAHEWGIGMGGITKAMQKDLRNKYGTDNWYDWTCNNWGTKWNACEPQVDEIYISFNTAWAHPAPIIQKLSEEFPNVTLEVAYADEDFSHNCAKYEMTSGVMTECEFPEGGSREAIELALEVGGDDEYYLYRIFEDYSAEEVKESEHMKILLTMSVERDYVDEDLEVDLLELAQEIAIDLVQLDKADKYGGWIKEAKEKELKKMD